MRWRHDEDYRVAPLQAEERDDGSEVGGWSLILDGDEKPQQNEGSGYGFDEWLGIRRMDSTTSTTSAAGDRARDEEANLVGDCLSGHSSWNRHKMRILSCWL